MDYRIKDLPRSDRPREKLRKNGISGLTDVELLSIMLRTGIKGKNVKELAAEILGSYSLDRLADRSLEELQGFKGVSEVKAGQLIALGELARRTKREERERIESFSDVKSRVEDMKFLEEERLRIFHLNSGNELLAEEDLEGGVDSVSFEPRKIFRNAIRKGASAVVIAHNHPSGNPQPTEQDIEVTEQLIEAGNTVGVELLDHVIVGKETSSIRSCGSAEIWDQEPL